MKIRLYFFLSLRKVWLYLPPFFCYFVGVAEDSWSEAKATKVHSPSDVSKEGARVPLPLPLPIFGQKEEDWILAVLLLLSLILCNICRFS